MLLQHLLLRFSVLLSVVQTYDHIKVILIHINLKVLTNRVDTDPPPLKFYGTQIIAIFTNHAHYRTRLMPPEMRPCLQMFNWAIMFAVVTISVR
jgi:hypothetical protein